MKTIPFDVVIPNSNRTAILRTIRIDVPYVIKDGEVILTPEALDTIERTQREHMMKKVCEKCGADHHANYSKPECSYCDGKIVIRDENAKLHERIAKLEAALKEAEAVIAGECGQDWADHFGPLFTLIEDAKPYSTPS